MKKKIIGFFILIFVISACSGGGSGELTGMVNLNPAPSTSAPTTTSIGVVEFVSASQKNVMTAHGYKVNASFGNKVTTMMVVTAGNYKVYLGAEGKISAQ